MRVKVEMIIYKAFDLVKYLVELGADITKQDNNSETPLFYACRSGNEY